MKIFIGVPFRIILNFLTFLLKIAISGLFVIVLQVKIQDRTLEQMLEQQLKYSSLSVSIRKKLFPVKEKLQEKKQDFPTLENLMQNSSSANKR